MSPDGFFQPQNTPKFVFGRGSASDPAGGAYDAPLVGWRGGHLLPIPLPLDAFGISILGALGASLLDTFSVWIRAKAKSASAPPLAFLF